MENNFKFQLTPFIIILLVIINMIFYNGNSVKDNEDESCDSVSTQSIENDKSDKLSGREFWNKNFEDAISKTEKAEVKQPETVVLEALSYSKNGDENNFLSLFDIEAVTKNNFKQLWVDLSTDEKVYSMRLIKKTIANNMNKLIPQNSQYQLKLLDKTLDQALVKIEYSNNNMSSTKVVKLKKIDNNWFITEFPEVTELK